MVTRINLETAVLRTFVTGFELGSFARAAERLGRSPSAVSTQLRKLEEQLGQKLVLRTGRGLALTAAGETLFGYAKRLLDLNDEAVGALRSPEVGGWVRLGLPQDLADSLLPAVLTRFSQVHPKARVEVEVGRSTSLLNSLTKGGLDIALVWGDGGDAPFGEWVADLPTHWIGRQGWPGIQGLRGDPLPLAAFTPPCSFRSAAVAALDGGDQPWRLAFTSPSLSGLWAAVEGGVGLTTRVTAAVPASLAVLDAATSGLPALPDASLAMHTAEAGLSPVAGGLRRILLGAVRHHAGRPSAAGPFGFSEA